MRLNLLSMLPTATPNGSQLLEVLMMPRTSSIPSARMGTGRAKQKGHQTEAGHVRIAIRGEGS